MNKYASQSLVRLTAEIRDIANALSDPTAIVLTMRSGTGVTDISGDVDKDSTGKYHADYLPTAEGVHEYKWLCTGAVQISRKGRFVVSKGAF